MLDELIYVKDLRILNVDLKDIIIIDNSVLSFVFHMDNGIPILPFYDNVHDNELKVLVNYLEHLSKMPDIGAENKKNLPLEIFKRKANGDEVSIDEYDSNLSSNNVISKKIY